MYTSSLKLLLISKTDESLSNKKYYFEKKTCEFFYNYSHRFKDRHKNSIEEHPIPNKINCAAEIRNITLKKTCEIFYNYSHRFKDRHKNSIEERPIPNKRNCAAEIRNITLKKTCEFFL